MMEANNLLLTHFSRDTGIWTCSHLFGHMSGVKFDLVWFGRLSTDQNEPAVFGFVRHYSVSSYLRHLEKNRKCTPDQRDADLHFPQ